MEAAGPSKNPLGRGLGWKCGSGGQAIGMPDQQRLPGLFAAAQQGEGGCITGKHCCSVVAVALLYVQHRRLFGSADCEQNGAAESQHCYY